MKYSISLSAVLVVLVTLFSPTAQAQRPNNPSTAETTTSTAPTRATSTRTTRPSANRGTTTRTSTATRGSRTRTSTTPRPNTNTTPSPNTNNPNYCPPGGNARTSNVNTRSNGRSGSIFGTRTSVRRSVPNARSTSNARNQSKSERRSAERVVTSYDDVYNGFSTKAVEADKAKATASRSNRGGNGK
ncbi:hypothetical protein FUA23_00345 [Neolewinella aurantiaca]|uniref:Uncharacterized protein n=1 Tax=Neolewinella aurantiaca TaxID=2602767 RepID=A0A5C7FNB6_9BACT|nr:hypothetical protein [Neolewinella aurantiaca]TXF91667.1 hypothetical protein FUA23_00345 [Neolewinella aurantiaca]